MSTKITVRDIDNRDDSGAPFEFTRGLRSVITYLDGPVRGDLTGGYDRIDEAIELLRAGDVEGAAARTREVGVYLTRADDGQSNEEGKR